MLPTPAPIRRRLSFALALSLFLGAFAAAQDLPFLSPVFGDHMVLQRNQPNRLWGWSTPGDEVTLTIAQVTARGTAGADGRWEVEFDPPATGGPYRVTLRGAKTVVLTDVLVGDVWLCSGQSNMAFGLNGVDNAEQEIATARFPQIRQLNIPTRSAYSPQAVVSGADWTVCSPETAGRFTAIGYLFARRINQDMGVPIGIIRAAVGGSGIECWMSPEALATIEDFKPHVAKLAELRTREIPREYGSFLMHWLDDYDVGQAADPAWSAPELDDRDWATVQVPNGFDDLGLIEQAGIAWFRKEVMLPDPLPAGRARLFLGRVDKMDTTYINGEQVGGSSWVGNPRRYFTRDTLKPGRNVIAVRVFKRPGTAAGIPADEGTPALHLGDGTEISLRGAWKGKVSVDASPPHPLPLGYENYPTMPTVMYQGMIAPLVPMAIRGALWYQGEENQGRGYQYRQLLPGLVADWRHSFQQPDLPIYAVGLPAFMGRKDQPAPDGWTEVREAQIMTMATQAVPHTGLAVAVDTGDASNIHPTDKQPLGERIALVALGETYGQDVIWHGPTYAAHETVPGAIKVTFTHTDGGIVVKGDQPAGEFAVAGEDRVFHWATATIDGDTLTVSSPAVPNPVAVRYAWQANPLANLYNGAGLPMVPFRTDPWPGATGP